MRWKCLTLSSVSLLDSFSRGSPLMEAYEKTKRFFKYLLCLRPWLGGTDAYGLRWVRERADLPGSDDAGDVCAARGGDAGRRTAEIAGLAAAGAREPAGTWRAGSARRCCRRWARRISYSSARFDASGSAILATLSEEAKQQFEAQAPRVGLCSASGRRGAELRALSSTRSPRSMRRPAGGA